MGCGKTLRPRDVAGNPTLRDRSHLAPLRRRSRPHDAHRIGSLTRPPGELGAIGLTLDVAQHHNLQRGEGSG
jgi:hypothetical protein